MLKFTLMSASAAVLLAWGLSAQATEAESSLSGASDYSSTRQTWRCDPDPFERNQQVVCWDSPKDPFFSDVSSNPFSPAFELKETAEAYVITADVPGVEEKDLDVTLSGTQLAVRGKRTGEKPSPSQKFLDRERSFGSFERRFNLPNAGASDGLVAQVDKGVLTVQVPKQAAPEPKRVGVRATGPTRMVVGSVP